MPSSTDTLETLLSATNRLTRVAAQRTGSTVSSVAWPTLATLAADGPRRNGDLARAMRVSQPGMTKVLNQLADDEWVSRIADVEDSRAWLIQITTKGRDALASWRGELARALEPLFSDLSAEDWSVLDRAADILAARTATQEVAA